LDFFSPIAAAHRYFYERPPLAPEQWDHVVAAANSATLPACVAAPLAHPNDLLLQPAVIQHVTRYFLAEGWHPRMISGLLHSRYASDAGWGDRWWRTDPRTRAEFDVRVFATMLLTGLDEAIDFNCRSAQDKDLCACGPCPFDLRLNRDRLLAMVTA